MNLSLHKLIEQGEHQEQDFKYCINDSKKIAISLVAFANTQGGRLLVGVKDNGKIAGISSDEEFYMVEAAAKIYSKPPISFSTGQFQAEGKTVLEIRVKESNNKPHLAKDDVGKWFAYFRRNDENKLANKVMLEVWRKKYSKKGLLINYSEDEKCLLNYLALEQNITAGKFSRIAHISYKKAERIIVDFIVLDILKFDLDDDKIAYCLNEDSDLTSWDIQKK